ncbi:hypothetical protein RUND412_010314 [Rhizina undulata]
MSHYNLDLGINNGGQLGDQETFADAFWNALADGGARGGGEALYAARWDWSEHDIAIYTGLPTHLGLRAHNYIIPLPALESLSPVTSGLPVEKYAGENVATEVSEALMEINGEDTIQAAADIVRNNVLSSIVSSKEESQIDIEDNEEIRITTELAEGNPAMALSLTEHAAANIFADNEESVNAPVSTDWYKHAPPIIQQPELLTLPGIQKLLPSTSPEQRMEALPIGTISDFQLPTPSPSNQQLREANPVTSPSAHSGPTVQQPQLDMGVLAQQHAVENNTLLVTASQANTSTGVNNTRMAVQEAAEAIVATICGTGMVPPSVRSPLLESLNVDEPAPMAPIAQEQQVPGLLTITQPPGPVSSGDIQPLLGLATEKQDEESGMDSSSPSSSMDYQNQSSKKYKSETQLSHAHVLKTTKLGFSEPEAAVSSPLALPSANTTTTHKTSPSLSPATAAISSQPHPTDLKLPTHRQLNAPVAKTPVPLLSHDYHPTSLPHRTSVRLNSPTTIADTRKRNSLSISRPRFRCIVSGCEKDYSSKGSVRRHGRQHHREVQWDPEAVQHV